MKLDGLLKVEKNNTLNILNPLFKGEAESNRQQAPSLNLLLKKKLQENLSKEKKYHVEDGQITKSVYINEDSCGKHLTDVTKTVPTARDLIERRSIPKLRNIINITRKMLLGRWQYRDQDEAAKWIDFSDEKNILLNVYYKNFLHDKSYRFIQIGSKVVVDYLQSIEFLSDDPENFVLIRRFTINRKIAKSALDPQKMKKKKIIDKMRFGHPSLFLQ